MYGRAIGLIKPSNCNLHNTALYANSCAKTGSHCCISFSLKMLKCSYRLKFVVGSTKYHKVSKNIPKHFRWKCNLKVSIKEQKYEQYQNRDCLDNHGAISSLCVQNVKRLFISSLSSWILLKCRSPNLHRMCSRHIQQRNVECPVFWMWPESVYCDHKQHRQQRLQWVQFLNCFKISWRCL